ncbi:hypothetical protein Hanom_Chr03g00248361 [Helianthus anomalus]
MKGCYFLHLQLLFSPPSSHILTGGARVGPAIFLSQGGGGGIITRGVFRISLMKTSIGDEITSA